MLTILSHRSPVLMYQVKFVVELVKLGKLQNPNFIKELKAIVDANPVLLLQVYYPLKCWDSDEKLKLASKIAEADPKALSSALLYLFEDFELNAHHDEIIQIIEKCSSLNNEEPPKTYLKNTKMFLEHQRRTHSLPGTLPASGSGEETPATSFPNNGVLWECVGTEPNGRGKNGIFKLRWEYDILSRRTLQHFHPMDQTYAAVRILNQIYPAIEAVPSLFTHSTRFSLIFAKYQSNPIYDALGYKLDTVGDSGFYATFPDRKALLDGWKALRETAPYKYLPPLSIASSKGIATYRDFLLSILEHDFLLGEGIEHVHDQMIHAFQVIGIISMEPEQYLQNMEKIREVVREAIAIIDNARDTGESRELCAIMEYTASALVDNLTAADTIATRETLLNNWKIHDNSTNSFIHLIWNEQSFWRRQLPSLGIENSSQYTVEVISNFWRKVQLQAAS